MTEFPTIPSYGDEKDMLLAFVDQQRATLLWKLEGLTDEQLRQPHAVTGFSLLGMLKHLVRVEQTWFQQRLMGEPIDGAPNDDTAWVPTDDETFDVLSLQYREACNRSNEIARTLPMDHPARRPGETAEGPGLQWVLLHMIEEIARHLGHADIMRQSIDGATGVNPAHAHGHSARKVAPQ
jgi:uncharacterized damage-inducible protein DinB